VEKLGVDEPGEQVLHRYAYKALKEGATKENKRKAHHNVNVGASGNRKTPWL
jgi:hypothetical protein